MSFPIPTPEGKLVTLRAVLAKDRESYLAHSGEAEAVWGFGGGKDDAGSKTQELAERWLKGRT